MKYLVALPLGEPALTYVAQLKTIYRPPGWRDTMPPHVTLLPPDRPLLPPAEAANKFGQLPLPNQTSRVQIGSLAVFSHGGRHTIVGLPSPSRELHHLFGLILNQSEWQATTTASKRPYVPHVTIVNSAAAQTTGDIMLQLKSSLLGLPLEFSKLTLYMKELKWPAWREIMSLQLNK
jgi:2'-5' RNA ligase